MKIEQFKEAKSIVDQILILGGNIKEIDNTIKSIKEREGINCGCELRVLGSYQIAQFDFYPLTKKVIEALVEHLNDRKEKYNNEIKELKDKFKKL